MIRRRYVATDPHPCPGEADSFDDETPEIAARRRGRLRRPARPLGGDRVAGRRSRVGAPRPGAGRRSGRPVPLDRTILPIPEPQPPAITELDVRNAKAPPRFEVKAPAGAPNVLIVLIDDMGFGQSSAFGGPIHMPTAERLAKGAAVQPVSHHGALLADPCRAPVRPQPSHVQHGLDHGDRHRVPRPDRAAAQQRGAAGRDAPPQWLRHRRLRQVARDRRLGGQHFGSDQSLADPLRLRQVLRVHRRRGQSVGAGDLRRDEPGRAAEGPELPLPDRHDRQGDRLGQGREVAHARQAVLHLLRPGATHAPHHVPKEWIARYKGRFDQGWDRLREETLARQKTLGRGPRRDPARAQAGGDQGLGQADRRREEALRPPDGGLRRLRRVRRPRGRPAGPGDRGPGPDGQHAHLLHPRRQRRQRRGGHERPLQRDDLLQRGRTKRSRTS